jgi:predicted permease
LDRGVWLPWDYNNETRIKDNWGSSSDGLTFVGRIKKGVSASQAEQILTPLAHDTWISNVADTPFFKGWSVDIEAYSFKDAIIGDSKRMLIFLITGVIGLVMIASANIANLFMSRTAEQQRQLAIFAAIGAKKSHLFRSLLAESSLLMLVSILVALAISSSGFYLMQTQFDQILPRVSELTLTFFTFGAAAVFAGLFALIFALISSRMINYRALNTTLQSSGKGTGVQVSKRFRQVLVVTQVAIATLLVFANIGLFNVSVDVINEPLGFNVDNMVNISVARPESLTDEEVAAAMASIKEKLLQLPQVQSVSHAHSPLDRFPSISLTDEVTNISFSPEYKDTDPTYFNQIGQALIAGNLMTEADIREETNASVVNEVFAKNLSPDGNVLGMKLRSSGFTFTVVGVVKNVKLPGQSESEIGNRIYLPVYSALSQLNLKLSPNQTITREQVIATIKDVSNSYSLFRFQVLSQKKDDQLFTQRSTATSTSTLTIITLFLAGVGLYGILSYSTQARRFEIGTRMAIGAKRNNLIGLIVRDNTTVIAIGILMSLVTMLTIYILNKESLASYVDMSLISAFAATLIAISSLALFACYWPLRKYINNPAIHLLRGNE